MIVVDWRDAPADLVRSCYEQERIAWRDRFAWDTTTNWRHVEDARAAGTLPGFIASSGGELAGWSFHLRHRTTLQIGNLTASSSVAAHALLTRILASPEATDAEGVMAFLPELACSVDDVFSREHFGSRRFVYLTRPLDERIELASPPLVARRPTPVSLRSFHAGRLHQAADVLARAYPGADPSRPFAPGGTPEEWTEYATQLVARAGCGTVLPWASIVETERPSERLTALVLVTEIAPNVGHIAQVAVDPSHRGRGSATRLLREVLARLCARGFTRATLLVAADNRPARLLYDRLGFVPSAAFLSTWLAQPRRSSRAACSTGGVSTLR